MHTSHNIHKHVLFFHSFNPEVMEYYVYKILSRVATSMANLAIPLFLFIELGYSVVEVILFYVILQLFFVLVAPFSSKIIERIGVKHAIALHIPFMAFFWFGLRFLSPGFWPNLGLVFVLLFFRSVPRVCREPAENFFIARNIMHKDDHGSTMANIRIVFILAGVLAPVATAIIAFFFGFDLVFNAAILLLFLSAVPLFLTHDKHFKAKFSRKKLFWFSFRGMTKNFWLAEFGRIIPDVAMWFLWPVFLFIALSNLLDVGLLLTLSAVIAIAFSHYLGKKLDKKSLHKFFNGTVVMSAVLFMLRAISLNPLVIAVVNILNTITGPALLVPYEKYAFDFMTSCDNLLEAVCARSIIIEYAYFAAILIVLGVFSAASMFFEQTSAFPFIAVFVISGILMLLMSRIGYLPKKANC